jgi:hypothetical protein
MRVPQFNVRSLLVLVLVAGLLLAVGILSVQNQRLRQENAKLHAGQQSLVGFFSAQIFTSSATDVMTSSTSLPHVQWVLDSATDGKMPNGPGAFPKSAVAQE